MARQPFARTYSGSPLQIGSSCIEQLPRVAELVGRIAINWSGVEAHLALALGSMLGVENPASVAVFLSLRNHRAQRDALRAAAAATLSGEPAEIFEAILRLHEEFDKQRNSHVHCVWGISANTPDGIIWSSLQAHANMLLADYHMEKMGQLTNETRTANMTKDLFVARYEDLEELNRSIIELERIIVSFHAYLRYNSQLAGDNAYRRLQTHPLIVEKRGTVATTKQASGG